MKPTNQSALAVMAGRLQCDTEKLLGTLKATVFKGATNEELMALTVVANTYNLNPLTKELYAFPAKSGGIVPVVSIDGWLRIINDHPQMDGMETSYDMDEAGQPISCTATIWRKDRTKPIQVTEFLNECRRNTDPWKMPFRMLRHKAIIQCARVAFGFSGIMDEDEAGSIKAVSGVVVEKKPFTPPQPKPEAPVLALSDEPETALQRLLRRIHEDKMDEGQVDTWLAKQWLPRLSNLMENEAEAVLAMYDKLKEEAK